MPRIVVQTEFQGSQAIQAAQKTADEIKRIFNAASQAAAPTAPPAIVTNLTQQAGSVGKVADEAKRLSAELKVAQSRLAGLDLEGGDPKVIQSVAREFERIRVAAAMLRDSGLPVEEAQQYAAVVTNATNAMNGLTAAQKGTKQVMQSGGFKTFIDEARELDGVMTRLEVNRKNGLNSLKAYRDELEAIRQTTLKKANDENRSDAERAVYAIRAKRAGSLIDAADTREAERLANGIQRVKALLVEEKISAEQASVALGKLAERSGELMEVQRKGSDVAVRYANVTMQARKALEQVSSAKGGDEGVIAAKAAQARLVELNAIRRVEAGTVGAKKANEQYRQSVLQLSASLAAESRNTLHTAAARREYTIAAERAVMALKKLRAEQLQTDIGGNAAFALNTVAFGFTGVGVGAGMFLQDALQLNEQAKQASLTLEATAKFYKQNVKDVLTAASTAAEETRQDGATTQQAVANLLRKTFTPEMAKEAVKRFSDAATAAGLDATKAIVGASEAILSEQSRQLNSAGIAENLGPVLTGLDAMTSKGEAYFKQTQLTNPKVREQYELLREQGKSFQEAAKAAVLYNFILKSTDPIAGRTAAATKTLTGALNNASVQYNTFKRGLVEGISIAAVPALNTFSKAMGFFNNAPTWVKSTAGLAAGLGVLAAVTIGASAGMIALFLQTKNVIMSTGVATAATGFFASAQGVLGAQVTRTNVALAAQTLILNPAARGWAFLTGGIVAATRASYAFLATPFGLAAAGIAAALSVATKHAVDTNKIYDDIEKRQKEFDEAQVARYGQEYVGALNKLMTLQEVKGQFQKKAADAITPEEKAAAEQRLRNIDLAIEKQRELLRALAEKNRAEKGSVEATEAQAEAYNTLRKAIEAVEEQYGNSKLSQFQKDIRSAQTAQKQLLNDIKKGESEYAKDNTTGLTPEQAAKLRKQAATVIPDAIKGLAARQAQEFRRAAIEGELGLQREQANLILDGIKQRKALLSVETRAIREEYRNRIQDVRKNRDDPNLTKDQRQVFAQEEQRLIAERDAKIKVQEEQTSRDLQKLRLERASSLLDITRKQVDGELAILRANQTALTRERDVAVSLAPDGNARLAIEEAFSTRQLALTRKTVALQGQIRRAEVERQYQEELTRAATLGEARGQAEVAAARNRALALKAVTLDSENDLAAARVEADSRVNQARAALVQEWVDEQLKGLQKVEGASLASIQRTLKQYEALYRSRGDAESLKVVQGALKSISEEIQGRAEKARDALTEGLQGVQEFSGKLAELEGRAGKGRQGAELAALKLFTQYANDIKKQREELEKVRRSLVNPDPALSRDIAMRLAVLKAQEVQVRAAGEQAAARAGAAYTAAQRDKAIEEIAKRNAALYDNGEGSLQPRAYRAALLLERTYWTARLQGLEKGSDEYEKRFARVQELDQLVKDVGRTESQQPLDRAKDALELLDAQGKLVTTEAERVKYLRQRLELLTRIQALETGQANDPTLTQKERSAALKASLGTQADMRATQNDLRNLRQDDLTASRAIVEAQLKVAQGDEARLHLQQQRLAYLRQELAVAQGEANNSTLTQKERQAAEIRALTLMAEVKQGENELADARDRNATALRDLVSAQVDANLTLARTDAEITRAIGQQVILAEQAIREQDKKITQLINNGAGTAEIADAMKERISLMTTLAQKETELARRGYVVSRQKLDYLEAQTRAQVALMTEEDQQAANLSASVQLSQLKLRILGEELSRADALRLTDEERRQKLSEYVQLQAEVIKGQRDQVALERQLLQAARQAAEERARPLQDKRNEAYKREIGESLQLAQEVENRLKLSQAELERTQQQLKTGLYETASQRLNDEQVSTALQARIAEDIVLLGERRKALGQLYFDANQVTRALFSELSGGTEQDRALQALERRTGAAREKLKQAEAEFNAANQGKNVERLKTATESLTSAIKEQRDSVKELSDAYQKARDDSDALHDSVKTLDETLNPDRKRGGEQFNTQTELDYRAELQAKRDRTLREAQRALESGDVQRIAQAGAALAKAQDEYAQQLTRLEKRGGFLFSDANSGQVRGVLDAMRKVDTSTQQSLTALEDKAAEAEKAAKAERENLLLRLKTEEATRDTLTETLAVADKQFETARLFAASAEQLEATTTKFAAAAQKVGTFIVPTLITVKIDASDVERELVKSRFKELVRAPKTPTVKAAENTPTSIRNQTFNTNVYVDGQKFPTVPSTEQIVQAVIPGIQAWSNEQSRRSGVNCD